MRHKKFYFKAGALWLSGLGRRGESSFHLNGQTYPYFHHPYNFTWLNERRVEIPVVRDVLSRRPGVRFLEVGNVLSHYDRSMFYSVVDKYETSSRKNLFTEDAETFSAGAPYDLIVSISTLEHAGQDESWSGTCIEFGEGIQDPGNPKNRLVSRAGSSYAARIHPQIFMKCRFSFHNIPSGSGQSFCF